MFTTSPVPEQSASPAGSSIPPGPSSVVPFRLLMAFRRDPLSFLLNTARRYGDVARYHLGSQEIFLLSHPDFVRDVLVTHARNGIKGRVLQRSKLVLGEGLLTSEGDHHLRQRRLTQPAFHRQRLNGYGAVMVEEATRARSQWQAGQSLDFHAEMMRLTLSIVARTLFHTNVQADANEVAAALSTFMKMFGLVFLPFSEYLEMLPVGPIRRLHQARQRLDRIVYRMIRERRAGSGDAAPDDRGDLLSMLLQAQDLEGDGGGMSDQQVRDECVTLILAGHETTANALTWTWYLLAQHPDVEQRLHAELDAALHGASPSVDDLPRLPYTEMVLAESMRLYPPAWGIARKVVEPFSVGGYRIPKGALVLMSQWVLHHDPRYFPEPSEFNPERWTPQARAARPKFCYFPFGAGPRQCIGEGFAWMEGILLIATIAQQWRIRLAPGQKIELQPVITLRPRHGVRMLLERR
jgi:cytochrome P450